MTVSGVLPVLINVRSTSPALEAVYAEHGAYLRAFAKAAGVLDEDVEDVVHDTIASLHARLEDRPPDRASLETWLLAAASNHVGKHHRRQARASDHGKDAAAPLLDAADLEEEEALCKELRRVLDTMLTGMAPPRRAVFECRHVQRLSWAAIAETLGISESTAMRRDDEAVCELENAYARRAAGRAHPLPFPIFLELLLDGQHVPISALPPVTARDAGELGARMWPDAVHRPDPSAAMLDATAPSGSAWRVERRREPTGTAPLFQRLWRSRLTHYILGAVVGGGVAQVYLSLTSPVPPPPQADVDPSPPAEPTLPPPLSASVEAVAPSLRPRADASSMAPSKSAPARTSVAQPSESTPHADPEAVDRYLLKAAQRAMSDGRQKEAIEFLQRHAEQFPDSKRAAQRATMLAQLLQVRPGGASRE